MSRGKKRKKKRVPAEAKPKVHRSGFKNSVVGLLVVASFLPLLAIGAPVFSGMWAPEADPTIVRYEQNLQDLQNSVGSLITTARSHGVPLPDNAGINDVTAGMNEVAPVDGYTAYGTVSTAGAVKKGDPVRYTLEPNTAVNGTASLFQSTNILAMCSGSADWTNSELSHPASPRNANSAYVYESNGKTSLTVMNKNGYVAHATVCEGVATSADVCVNFDKEVFVVYTLEGKGYIKIYQTSSSTYSFSMKEVHSAEWATSGSPEKVRMVYDSMDSRISLVCVRTDESDLWYGSVYEINMNFDCDKVESVEEIKLTPEDQPNLYNLELDVDRDGWDIDYSQYDNVFVTCPTTSGGQAVIYSVRNEDGHTNIQGYILSKIREGGIDASLDLCICEGGMENLLLARNINYDGKNQVYWEIIWQRRSDGKPHIVHWGSIQNSKTDDPITQVRVCNNLYMSPYTSQFNGYGVSWVTDGGVYFSTIEVNGKTGIVRRSPGVRVASTTGVGAVMERSGSSVKVVYQQTSLIEGYTSMYRRISTCEPGEADGYALADGLAGASINFMRTETW